MRNIYLILLGLSISLVANAQEAINASGGNASGSSGIVSYSVGQMIYTTSSETNGSVVQGVQQPFEISVVTVIDPGKRIELNCSAYPNPTTDFLGLKVDIQNKGNLKYQLYDINGKLLRDNNIEAGETRISMLNLVPSTYFLKIIQMTLNSTEEVKTFKIIKN